VVVQLGMIGLGRMGANIVRRLMRAGHACVVFDRDPAPRRQLAADGAVAVEDLAALVRAMDAPRHVWGMLPAGEVTEDAVRQLADLLSPGDSIIDGGNTFWKDDVRRARELKGRGIGYLDVGTSGGVWGLERGYCLMIGGEADAVARLDPIFAALAPGLGDIPRTKAREGRDARAEQGYLHAGPNGAGHFVKMIHNGIEYGLMAAYAEGLAVLERANLGGSLRPDNAAVAPLQEPHRYQFDLDLAAVAELWRRGSVITSWLLDLTAAALRSDPDLSSYAGHVSDSGEGRWTVQSAVDLGVPVQVIASALWQRFSSRDEGDFADRTLSAMRHQFGGHAEAPSGG
jgi:6-phosphogluconate dehydrogenase